MSVTIHGIPNCDVMKKARTWLDGQGIAYRFHDYRTDGVTRELVEGWVARVGWEVLLNKASTTFKELPESRKRDVDEARAVALMVESPTVIKRPVLDIGTTLLVGFKPDAYEAAFAAK